MTAGLVTGPAWPERCFALDLDALGPVTLDDLAALERRGIPSIGVIRGCCQGPALAVALAVDLVVAGPEATFAAPGAWTDIVVRRGKEVMGRKAVGYLAMTGRPIDAAVARRWGLVTYVDPRPVEAAQRLVELVSARSAVAVATILRQVHRGAGPDYALSALTSPPVE